MVLVVPGGWHTEGKAALGLENTSQRDTRKNASGRTEAAEEEDPGQTQGYRGILRTAYKT